MGDLINRNVAIDALRAIKHGLWEIDIPSPTVPEYVEHHEQIKNMMEIVDGWIKRINGEPAVDAVPVVRCKECKHSEYWYRDKRRCFLWHETWIDVFEDGYCNYAERKDNG